MLNRTSLTPDPDKSSSDWLAAAPSLGMLWLACMALAAPVFLAAGVYWLHSAPAGVKPRTFDTVMELRLLPSQKRVDQQPEAVLRSNRSAQSEPLAENPSPPASEAIAKSASLEAVAASPSGEASTPASSAAPVRASANRKILMFRRALETHIAKYRRYPEEARRKRLQGTVEVLFAMRRDGAVTDVWVRNSSGQPALDAAAAAAIRRAQPLPRIPSELPDRLTVAVPVAFDMP